MIKGLLDPAAFAPPRSAPTGLWVTRVRHWSSFFRDVDQELFLPLMSTSGQAALATALGGISGIREALERDGVAVSAIDVMNLVEGIRARSLPLGANLNPPAIAPNSVELSPSYVAGALDDASKEDVEGDLAHLAVASNLSEHNGCGFVSAQESWSEVSRVISTVVEQELWELEGEVRSVPDDKALIKEDVPLWINSDDVYSVFESAFKEWLLFPEIALEVAYRKLIPSEDRSRFPLKYSFGPNFVGSIEAVGFSMKKGRLATLFRLAARIACGRVSQSRSLDARPYRTSAGGSAKDYERGDGVKLMRGSLGTGPSAARIMWWDGSSPEILGVVSHDSDPLSLI